MSTSSIKFGVHVNNPALNFVIYLKYKKNRDFIETK